MKNLRILLRIYFIWEIFSSSLQREFWNMKMSSENFVNLCVYINRRVYKIHNYLDLNVNKQYTHRFQLFEIQFPQFVFFVFWIDIYLVCTTMSWFTKTCCESHWHSFSCPICKKKTFSRKTNVSNHMKVHEKKKRSNEETP